VTKKIKFIMNVIMNVIMNFIMNVVVTNGEGEGKMGWFWGCGTPSFAGR